MIPPSWPVYFPRLRFAEDDSEGELVAVLARFFSSEIGFELIIMGRADAPPPGRPGGARF